MDERRLTPENYSAVEVVALLALEPLEREGGYFRRIAEGPPDPTTGRPAYSVILFLITPGGFSALHRLAADEVWCFLAGDSLESLRLHPDGIGAWVRLGLDMARGEHPADVVKAGTWQGTQLVAGGRWALVAATMTPAFDWSDFEAGDRDELAALYPAFAGAIGELTR